MSGSFPERAAIDADLIRGLLREQFPAWAELPVHPVVHAGNDHRMFRLGRELVVRLPAAVAYVPQVRKEQQWLPRLRRQLTLQIPEVVGRGDPSDAFPAPWSVYDWIDGRRPEPALLGEDEAAATALGDFLSVLQDIDSAGGPVPGSHSAGRGAPVEQWDDQVSERLGLLPARQRDRAAGVWRDATTSPHEAAAVWLHGDVAIGNLLVDAQHSLRAVLDFGCSAVGDPACDTVIFWTQFRAKARQAFRRSLRLDDATWARGAGWALWKGLIMLTNAAPGQSEFARRVLHELLGPS
ncbi:aminoglycoside phosphotransferase family protein [Microbacterium sp.]|uniref:aminoglycoside phosphotransferase family protein n=1 Tax=Microbacterium sp. TaxID=51671 RepID=UPI0028B137BD|nr:aminoglycoside phosphotransferase family protein [Microbacterium sp.]